MCNVQKTKKGRVRNRLYGFSNAIILVRHPMIFAVDIAPEKVD